MPKGPILLNTKGRPWTKDSINCRFDRLKKKLGKRACAYAIRHTYATEGLLKGLDSLTLSQLMGHADTTQLSRTYAPPRQESRLSQTTGEAAETDLRRHNASDSQVEKRNESGLRVLSRTEHSRHSACQSLRTGADSTTMTEQLRLWGDQDDKPASSEERAEAYPTPPEPPPETPAPPTSLDRDLNLLYLDYLGRSAERIAVSIESNQAERRARYVRMINYELRSVNLVASNATCCEKSCGVVSHTVSSPSHAQRKVDLLPSGQAAKSSVRGCAFCLLL